jgi:hypothetical protein
MAKKIVNIVMYAVMILMNYLANALPLNNKTTGELSNQYPNLFVPAGVTFSIWGVIYLLLLGFIIVQFMSSNKKVVESIGWLFAIKCFLNAAWIVAWHYEMLVVSVIIMLSLLATLVLICREVQHLSLGLIKAAFGVYLGWICVATIANITALLVYYGWDGWGIPHVVWASIMIVAGLIIAGIVSVRFQNPFVGLAVIWAFLGIVIKRNQDFEVVATVAMVSIGVMVVLTFWMFLYPSFYKSGVK